jgi:hypothetical protein
MYSMKRILYVDGFNFYYGVTAYWHRQRHLAGLGWCNFAALVQRHFPAAGSLQVKYFTAPVTQNVQLENHRPGEHRRYGLWRRAVQTIEDLLVVEGFYKRDNDQITQGASQKGRVEKQTDVNLAVELMVDAFGPPDLRPEHVFILSGDCDQMPAVFAVHERTAVPIRITILLPSESNRRHWEDGYNRTRSRLLKNRPAGARSGLPAHPLDIHVLDEAMLATSLLCYTLTDSQGEFVCPDYWRLSAAYLEQHCQNADWRPDLAVSAAEST